MSHPVPFRLSLPLLVLGSLGLGLASCSGGGGGGGSFAIVSCSLGCSGTGSGGDGQVSCGIQDVYVNGELRIGFDGPVDEDSLNAFSVQVAQVGSGKTPPADRFVDPADPTVLVYRPKLSFDSSGAPVFGLAAGQSYTIKLPGAVEDPGSQFVRSTGGAPNQHRMLCTVDASLGVLDVKQGAPKVTVTVDKVVGYDPVTGEPSEFEQDVLADGAVDIWRFSRITLHFDDLMNPATLVNPVTKTSSTLKVTVDPDGVTSDPSDQQELFGDFTILLDQQALTTTVTFDAELGFPSAGSNPSVKRKVVVQLPPSIVDLGGNPLANGGSVAFTPEFVAFEQLDITEQFVTTARLDQFGTGADWGKKFPGILLPGIAGGSGRLGHLRVPGGSVVVLNTDDEDFSAIEDEEVFVPANVIDATFDGTSFTVPPIQDGIFEFASLEIEAGGQLVLEGTHPARIFVRGEALIGGLVEAAGTDSLEHDDTLPLGGEATPPGPSGGAGGAGGRLPTWVGFESVSGTIVPGGGLTPPTLAQLNGQDGEPVPDNLLAPTGTYGGGGGGMAWPQPTASQPQIHLPTGPTDVLGLVFDGFLGCATNFKGSVGAGGAFALNGLPGQNKPAPGGLLTEVEPPVPAAGLASGFSLGIGSDPESPQRRLDPEEGWLHGGGGGGGGGAHVQGTSTNGTQLTFDPTKCHVTPSLTPAVIINYRQRSGPAGGGGGGAVQIQAGANIGLSGTIDASGGQGGGKTILNAATAGGGGAGGAVLLQSPGIQILSVPGRINVSGGVGGFGIGGSLGGDGGAGLVRFESSQLLSLAAEAPKISPTPAALASVGALPQDVVSIGLLETQDVGPGTMNGAMSCWMRPEGNFFVLTFLEDEGDELGWDMKLMPNPVSIGQQSFRGENDLFAVSLETLLGNELGSSPVVVRFQGARAFKQIDDLCDVEIGTVDSAIYPGSLTGWVEHPAELNGYFADPGLASNLIRFQILFDETDPFAGAILGVTEVTFGVLPD